MDDGERDALKAYVLSEIEHTQHRTAQLRAMAEQIQAEEDAAEPPVPRRFKSLPGGLAAVAGIGGVAWHKAQTHPLMASGMIAIVGVTAAGLLLTPYTSQDPGIAMPIATSPEATGPETTEPTPTTRPDSAPLEPREGISGPAASLPRMPDTPPGNRAPKGTPPGNQPGNQPEPPTVPPVDQPDEPPAEPAGNEPIDAPDDDGDPPPDEPDTDPQHPCPLDIQLRPILELCLLG